MANWNSIKTLPQDDLLGIYDHYINKFRSEYPEVVVDTIETPSSASLIVVDMQDDFILPNVGRFAVTSGPSVIPGLKRFIDANKDKLTKILFTRDAHPVDHCSFTTMGGNYPPHCIINHLGARIHPDFHVYKDLPNVDVVFKGMYRDADSYGAVDYPQDEYRNQRQAASSLKNHKDGGCCRGSLCSLEVTGANGSKHMVDKTGARYLKNKALRFEDYPFEGIERCMTTEFIIKPDMCPQAKAADVLPKVLPLLEENPFAITDLFGGKTEGTHTVFVTGLAGDYCVKDTAINLAKKVKQLKANGELPNLTVNVVAVQPYTRYPTLPITLMTWNPLEKYTAIPAEGEAPKNINAYLFKQEGEKIRRLSKQNIQGLAGKSRKNIPEDELVKHRGFINPIKPILNDYKNSGVKLLMTEPNLSAIAGGARRTNKTRKNCWPKRTGGARKGTRKPIGHKKGCKCIICRRR